MSWTWWVFLLLMMILCVYLISITREPKSLRVVKERYKVLTDYLKTKRGPKKFDVLADPIIITASTNTDELGYNSNKGYEIGLCLDGDPNDIFHVLLHELSHSTVEEYDHSEQFWKNFSELRDICVDLGIYQRIPQRKAFCGKFIQD